MPSAKSARSSYGQYCPLALAAELLCRRWTILVISRLVDGCTTFTEIHQGVPKISPSLLSTRLAELQHAGIITKTAATDGGRSRYALTDAGADLSGLIDGMAVWGQQWSRDMNIDDLDPAFLAWSMSQRIDRAALPPGRTVVEFEFFGTPTEFRRFWLINSRESVDMCLKHPGHDTDLLVRADIRCFVEAWRGFRDLRQEISEGNIVLKGPRPLIRAFPDWLLLSGLAPYERKRPGAEARLAKRKS